MTWDLGIEISYASSFLWDEHLSHHLPPHHHLQQLLRWSWPRHLLSIHCLLYLLRVYCTSSQNRHECKNLKTGWGKRPCNLSGHTASTGGSHTWREATQCHDTEEDKTVSENLSKKTNKSHLHVQYFKMFSYQELNC